MPYWLPLALCVVALAGLIVWVTTHAARDTKDRIDRKADQ